MSHPPRKYAVVKKVTWVQGSQKISKFVLVLYIINPIWYPLAKHARWFCWRKMVFYFYHSVMQNLMLEKKFMWSVEYLNDRLKSSSTDHLDRLTYRRYFQRCLFELWRKAAFNFLSKLKLCVEREHVRAMKFGANDRFVYASFTHRLRSSWIT